VAAARHPHTVPVTLNAAALVTAATAARAEITHLQAHSAAPGAGYTANPIGARVPATGTVDAAGKITWANVAFTGLPASGPVWGVSYWTAATGGAARGGQPIDTTNPANDTTANAAGAITFTTITETPTVS
jgi:hypothetical protein